MDFLYADLNEIVDPFAYTVEKTDGTIKMDIDNNKRILSAKVIYTPGQLTINNGQDEVISFNGSTNKTVQIPQYKIVRVQPDKGDIRSQYVLMKWDFSKEQYVQVDGDTIYLEEQIDELNIENGSISNEDSKKIGTGNSSISSVKYKHNGVDVFVPIMNSAVDNSNQQSGSVKIVGLKSGKEIHGGTETGVQSFAFGGQPYGISQQTTLCVTTISGSEWYDIVSEQPLVLKSIVSENSQNITEDIVNGKYNSTINLPIDGGIQFVIIRQNGKIENISPYNVLQRNSIQTKIIRGYEQCPTAKGNQSVSIGGGTQADYNWSQAFGLGTITSRPGQMVVGMYNELEPDALLIVGNGYYDALTGDIHRSNAAAIMRDGTIKTYNGNDNPLSPDNYEQLYEKMYKEISDSIMSNFSLEDWQFTLEDGTTVTKKVYVQN